ncbi:MAG: ABC transporter permease [Burkholderiales bacterium]|nr:ABC transporter permease [Anaerolineae bacterium]
MATITNPSSANVQMSNSRNITRQSGMAKFFTDLKYLWLEQILEVRAVWYLYLTFSVLLPFAMIFGFTRMGSGLRDYNSLLYIITGASIFAVTNDGLYTLAVRMTTMKKEGMLLYYASLPISKIAFVMAIILSRLVITLPGMLISIFGGLAMYGAELNFSLWIVVVLVITALALSSIGMALGALVDNVEVIQVVSNVLLFVLIMAAPVFIPYDALPLPLQLASYLFPPTYAAAALRLALSGNIGPEFYGHIAVLLAMTVVSFAILNRWIRWRV